jgi:hypothetical protein
VATIRNRSRDGSASPLVAARKPTPTGSVGADAPAEVVGDRVPRLRVSGEDRVGLTAGGLQTSRVAFDHGVPRIALGNGEAHARATPLRLERVAVVAAA